MRLAIVLLSVVLVASTDAFVTRDFGDEKARPRSEVEEDFERRTGNSLENFACSWELEGNILDYIQNLELEQKHLLVADFKTLARDKLVRCVRQFDKDFSKGYGYMLEWSFDRLLKELNDSGRNEPTQKQLQEHAKSLDLEKRISTDKELCRLAVAFNRLRPVVAGSWLGLVVSGFAKVGWLTRPQLNKMLTDALKKATAIDCDLSVWRFFDETCRADGQIDQDTQFRLAELAVAFGAEQASLMGDRTRKYQEYRHLCKVYRTMLRGRQLWTNLDWK